MRYLGGKSRIAGEIAAVVAPRGLWWEPFCGGLSVSVQLAKYGPGIVSDVNPALIALYQAVRDGWQPPTSVSREEYEAAKRLPDSDPRKAFCGFGCSFGGKWFKGYSAERGTRLMQFTSGRRPATFSIDQARATANRLQSDIHRLSSCSMVQADFFKVKPERGVYETLYCDPPYLGATGYASGHFDHPRFWQLCQAWADCGSRVFVSELSYSPHAHEVAWTRPTRDRLRASNGSQRRKLEHLFRVLPSAVVRTA